MPGSARKNAESTIMQTATVAKEFARNNIRIREEIPEEILIDQGTNFVNDIFKNVCKLSKINEIQTSVYHLESNRALKRSHRTFT